VGDMLTSVSPRTCNSPQNAMDFISDTVPDSLFPGALDGDARTAGAPGGSPETECEQPCLPADGLLRTAVLQPYAGTHTTENLPVTNGQILESSGEGTAANGVELHTVGCTDMDLSSQRAQALCRAPFPLASPPSPGPAFSTTLCPLPPRPWRM
jgi:ubiquitin carboxyl-terminal hydrolase 10